MKRVNKMGRMAEKARSVERGGAGGKMGVIPGRFPFTPPPPLYYRHTHISLCTIISKLLIFNVAGQSQILILHFLLTALTIPQSLILLASVLFLFISLSVYLTPPFSVSSRSLSLAHTHKHTLFLSHSHPLCLS